MASPNQDQKRRKHEMPWYLTPRRYALACLEDLVGNFKGPFNLYELSLVMIPFWIKDVLPGDTSSIQLCFGPRAKWTTPYAMSTIHVL
jgi:hypothetical protein